MDTVETPLDLTAAYEAARRVLDAPMGASLIGTITDGDTETVYAGTIEALVTDLVNFAAPAILEAARQHLAQVAADDLTERQADMPIECEDPDGGWCHYSAANTAFAQVDGTLRTLIEDWVTS